MVYNYSKTIQDSCSCGGRFSITGEYVSSNHEHWLDAHEVCRVKATQALSSANSPKPAESPDAKTNLEDTK